MIMILGMDIVKSKFKYGEAFNIYFKLGSERSYKRVAKMMGVKERTVARWAKKENWQTRIEQRDIEVSRGLEKKINEAVIDEKAAYRQDIKAAMAPIRNAIKEVIDEIKAKQKIGQMVGWVKSIDDYERLIRTYERMAKLDLLLLGEKTGDEQESNVKVNVYIPDNGRPDKLNE